MEPKDLMAAPAAELTFTGESFAGNISGKAFLFAYSDTGAPPAVDEQLDAPLRLL
jgi:hypothetical protein